MYIFKKYSFKYVNYNKMFKIYNIKYIKMSPFLVHLKFL